MSLTRDADSIVIHYGFGQDIWDVPFDHITKFYQVCLIRSAAPLLS
jgi:hypothetical protein